ncbi:MAG: RNA 2',3'-cyclic phosphodiesterase [Deltaproteobacteria bacterium]|nr:RNA 2',3'-cyclic phosphodiesterase [Deltaproteobacteria bacterium]
MRVFIGIGLPQNCRRAIAEAISPLRGKRTPISWTQEDNLHVTLKFLGETPPERIEDIGLLLDGAAAGIPPFELAVEEAGGFPGLRTPRVLWVGIREPLELVGKLHENIENALSAAGFPREERRFHPHVTVGRARDRLPEGWGEQYAKALSGKRFGVVGVNSFQLYESRLSPGGAVYRVLRDVPLS